jgi:hypothetical protein
VNSFCLSFVTDIYNKLALLDDVPTGVLALVTAQPDVDANHGRLAADKGVAAKRCEVNHSPR